MHIPDIFFKNNHSTKFSLEENFRQIYFEKKNYFNLNVAE